MTPDNVPTGAARRRLTVEEAMRGAKPEPYTPAEWRALHRASDTAAADGQRWAAERDGVEPVQPISEDDERGWRRDGFVIVNGIPHPTL